MGEITYGFYLWHIPLIVCARGLGMLPGGIAARRSSCCPVAIAFGAASWYLVERPIMRRAARLPRAAARRGAGPADAATAARSARSRSRIPARSGSLPASSSARAAASSTVIGISFAGTPRLIASIMNSDVWNCSWRSTSCGSTDERTAR